MKKIRWVLAHEPIELFVKGAEVFANEVNSKAPDQLQIEILTLSEYSEKYNSGVAINKHDLVQLLNDNKIEMGQTYTVTLGKISKDFQALDLPFLFSDHAHATRVFEGPVGKQLLDGLSNSVNVKGLAFTYSGGFRIIPGNKQINSIDDLVGLKVRTSFSPVAQDVFSSVGAIPVPLEIEELTENINVNVDAGESTYPRIYALNQNTVCSVINHTEHSLFLTTILMSGNFWNDLTPELQQIVSDAALSAARYERELSIEDVSLTREKCADDGITIIDLPLSEKSKFKLATDHLYEKYNSVFSSDLIKNIQNS